MIMLMMKRRMKKCPLQQSQPIHQVDLRPRSLLDETTNTVSIHTDENLFCHQNKYENVQSFIYRKYFFRNHATFARPSD